MMVVIEENDQSVIVKEFEIAHQVFDLLILAYVGALGVQVLSKSVSSFDHLLGDERARLVLLFKLPLEKSVHLVAHRHLQVPSIDRWHLTDGFE